MARRDMLMNMPRTAMGPLCSQAGLALESLSKPSKPDVELEESVYSDTSQVTACMPNSPLERTPRASYYCIETSRAHNRLEHQHHLRKIKHFMKEHTAEQLQQKVMEKRLQEFDEIDVPTLQRDASERSISKRSAGRQTEERSSSRLSKLPLSLAKWIAA